MTPLLSQLWMPTLDALYMKNEGNRYTWLLQLHMSSEANIRFGSPQTIWTAFEADCYNPQRLDITLQVKERC